MKLNTSDFVRFAVATVACAIVTLPANAAIAGGGGIAFVQTIQSMSGAIQAIAYPVTAIGGTLAAVSIWKAHHEMKQIGHGALEIAALGGIALGVPSLLALVPGIQGALI